MCADYNIYDIILCDWLLEQLAFTDIVNMNCTTPDYPYKTDEEIEAEEKGDEPPEDPKAKKKWAQQHSRITCSITAKDSIMI